MCPWSNPTIRLLHYLYNMETTQELVTQINLSFEKAIAEGIGVPEDQLDLNEVIENLSMRYESDIVKLLPYIMKAVLKYSEEGREVDSIEYLYYMFLGNSDEADFSAVARDLVKHLNSEQIKCILTWMEYLHQNKVGEIALDDLESGMSYLQSELQMSAGE